MAIEKTLVPVDGSAPSARALDVAGDLAVHYGAEVLVLHVVHGNAPRVPNDVAAYERYEHIHLTQRELFAASGNEIVERAEKRLRDVGVANVSTVVEPGHPAQVIVMGRRGLGNLPGLLLGSVSQKVAHLVDRTLVTVP